jgi:replication-associated recombination protein RarA
MECLPPGMAGKKWYFPTDRGLERRVRERLEELKVQRGGAESAEDARRKPE